MRTPSAVWRCLILPVLLGSLCAWSEGASVLAAGQLAEDNEADLQLAQRYFSRRRRQAGEPGTERALPLIGASAAEGGAPGHGRLVAKVGTRWRVEVRLARPELRPLPKSADLKVDYEVIEAELGPVARWVVRLTSASWTEGLSWEQMRVQGQVSGRVDSRIRPCREGLGCGPWRTLSSEEAIPTAGEHRMSLGIQAPIFVWGDAGSARWEEEDFFGRSQGWEWSWGAPWPERLWNAQAEVRLVQGEVQ